VQKAALTIEKSDFFFVLVDCIRI